MRKVAAALNEQAAGEALIARMDAKLARSHGAWGGSRALYLTPGGFTAGQGTLVGAMLAGAGLVSAGGSASYAPVTLEDLVLKPPAALVLGFFRDLEGGGQRGTIAGNGYLQALARRRTIASLPGSIRRRPGLVRGRRQRDARRRPASPLMRLLLALSLGLAAALVLSIAFGETGLTLTQ